MKKRRPWHERNPYLSALEHFIDRSIPYLLILLGIMLLLENPFWVLVHLDQYEPWVGIFDSVVVIFFILDLSFKWVHVRKLPKFLKLYWLDLIAVMPFYLFFRIYARAASLILVGEEIAEAQRLAHEAVLAREAEVLKEAKVFAREE